MGTHLAASTNGSLMMLRAISRDRARNAHLTTKPLIALMLAAVSLSPLPLRHQRKPCDEHALCRTRDHDERRVLTEHLEPAAVRISAAYRNGPGERRQVCAVS